VNGTPLHEVHNFVNTCTSNPYVGLPEGFLQNYYQLQVKDVLSSSLSASCTALVQIFHATKSFPSPIHLKTMAVLQGL